MSIVQFLNKVNGLVLNPIILLLFTLSFIYFAYGVVKFLSLDVADSSRKEAKDAIIWGIVGMFIMFSVYGIIALVMSTLGITTGPNALPSSASDYLQQK